ncbi:MAG: RdgB/HAM1 family non-canonical purine NTP pyrophosphatase [Acholeplasmatales bacterium]|nr:MAG: RdgB/HAM1 family non-canonical purine NTP pyrophosphatase [Acholeplasmatales bacterium]
MHKKMVIATRNKGKLTEYEHMLQPLGFEIFSLFDFSVPDIPETGETFFENARIKALAMRQHTRELILADDSGLVVDALGGAPGVHSKRYSEAGTDDANNEKLLQELAVHHDRRARFIAVIVLVLPSGEIRAFNGELPGYIHTECVGELGFGYDPLFLPVGRTETLAELGPAVKNRLSHRARALRQLLDYLQAES